MKILLVNKFLYARGGAEIAMLEEARLLQEKGHDVAFFSMNHPQNQYSAFDKYFASYVDLSKPVFSLSGIKSIGRMIYSFEAKKKFQKLLKDFKPDIIHYHNIYHQLSPSILSAAKKMSIPSVMTLHDYKLICPNYLLFNNSKGDVCEKCKQAKYYQPFFQKCFKNSRLAGLIIGKESAIHRLLKIYEKNIDLFICPSNFTKNKIVSWGRDEKQFRVLPHFIDLNRFKQTADLGDYIVAFGRLEKAKGFDVLIEAMKGVPNIKLKIIGSGSDENELKSMAKESKNIEFIPHLGWNSLIQEIGQARLVVNISKYYETFGMTVLESMALGKVVICNDRGAVEELIQDGETGIQVKVGDIEMLRNKIQSLYDKKEELLKMGGAARRRVEKDFGEDKYYLTLMDIFNSLLTDGGDMG